MNAVVGDRASAVYYAQLVREKSALRELARTGSQISKCGWDGENDAAAAGAQARTILAQLIDRFPAVFTEDAP